MELHSTLLWPSYDYLHCAQREAGVGSYFCIFSKDAPQASGKEAGDRSRFLCPQRETHLVCIPVSERVGCQTRVGAAHLFLRFHKEISVEVCAQIKYPSRWSPLDECLLLCKAWSMLVGKKTDGWLSRASLSYNSAPSSRRFKEE